MNRLLKSITSACRATTGGRLRRLSLTGVTLALLAVGTGTAAASPKQTRRTEKPLEVTVFSPGRGDKAGTAGAGNVVDLAIDASKPKDDDLLSPEAGYTPFFNDPSATTFHPGADPGDPGLVVLLSTTPTIPGTPFQGPDTNLAGLFQINGVATVNGDHAETWSTWLVGKPLFGTGSTTLTVYVVEGTAPTLLPALQPHTISNIVRVPFEIAG
jgi:hypothetical protein